MYHPDKNPKSNLNIFNEVMNMKNILADPYFQKLYDRFGEYKFDEKSK